MKQEVGVVIPVCGHFDVARAGRNGPARGRAPRRSGRSALLERAEGFARARGWSAALQRLLRKLLPPRCVRWLRPWLKRLEGLRN